MEFGLLKRQDGIRSFDCIHVLHGIMVVRTDGECIYGFGSVCISGIVVNQ